MMDIEKNKILETLCLMGREIGWRLVPSTTGTDILFDGPIRVIHQNLDLEERMVFVSQGLSSKIEATFEVLEKKFRETDEAEKETLRDTIFELESKVASHGDELRTAYDKMEEQRVEAGRAEERAENKGYEYGYAEGEKDVLKQPSPVSEALLDFCTYQCPRNGGEIVRDCLGGPRCYGCLAYDAILLGNVDDFP